MKATKEIVKDAQRYNEAAREIVKDYTETTGESFTEVFSYFQRAADPYNLKSPHEAAKALYNEVQCLKKN